MFAYVFNQLSSISVVNEGKKNNIDKCLVKKLDSEKLFKLYQKVVSDFLKCGLMCSPVWHRTKINDN